MTVKLFCDSFLTFKEAALESGELNPAHVRWVPVRLHAQGRHPGTIEMRRHPAPRGLPSAPGAFTKRWGLVRTGNNSDEWSVADEIH